MRQEGSRSNLVGFGVAALFCAVVVFLQPQLAAQVPTPWPGAPIRCGQQQSFQPECKRRIR